jgi:hypothetical protein
VLMEYAYSNIELRDVRNGRVAQITADGASLKGGLTAALGRLSGELGKMSIADFDAAPFLAILDPAQAKDTGYQVAYRQLSVGPYNVRFGSGPSMRIDSLTAENIGLRPSKLSLDDFLFLGEVTRSGIPPSPAQVQMLLHKVAGLYEGIHLGKSRCRASASTSAYRRAPSGLAPSASIGSTTAGSAACSSRGSTA